MTKLFITFALLFFVALGLELSSDNWDTVTHGKSLLVMFLAPWCKYCERMNPIWNKLKQEFNEHPYVMIADVECTSPKATSLCTREGVKAFPTVKYGDPNNLELYEGKLGYKEFLQFVRDNLGPRCAPERLELCDKQTKDKITVLMRKNTHELDGEIKRLEEWINVAEKLFEDGTADLDRMFAKAKKEREHATKGVEGSYLRMLKNCRTYLRRAVKTEM